MTIKNALFALHSILILVCGTYFIFLPKRVQYLTQYMLKSKYWRWFFVVSLIFGEEEAPSVWTLRFVGLVCYVIGCFEAWDFLKDL
jgi:NO-binding membrane sensor protein with MHYT domain